jgi:Flp pilus assembly protein TadD
MGTALLVACGGRDKDRKVVDTRPAASMPTATQPTSAEAPQPGTTTALPDGMQPGTMRDAAPPTPEETSLAWSEGVALYQSGEFETASQRLKVASTGRPDDAYTQYLFGLALWKSGHLDESESALVSSSQLNDTSEKTFVNLARVRLEKKDAQGALEATDRALTLKPGSSQALHQRGRALDALNRGDEARDTLQQARMADPANGYVANTLGYLLLRQGRMDEAIVELESARESLPEVAYVRNNLGVAYERRGDLDKAIAEFQAAVQAGDPDGKAGESLARLEPIQERLLARQPHQEDTPETSDVAQSGTGSDPEPPNR